MPVSMCLSLALSGCMGSQGETVGLAPIRQGGQAGSTTTSQGGTGGSTRTCIDVLSPTSCNTGDQQMTAGPGLASSELCPPERECYTLQGVCGSIVCALPEGVHCNDLLSCNPGDTRTTSADEDCYFPTLCYTNRLCAQSISCRATASPYGGICRGTWSDGGILEPPDGSADGADAGKIPCCGDGVIDGQYGEQCDLGPLNGVPLDTNKFSPSFWSPDPYGIVLCDLNCTNPNTLCALDWAGGMICD
jgi:hypothetical protein